jgi:hypothetical protein
MCQLGRQGVRAAVGPPRPGRVRGGHARRARLGEGAGRGRDPVNVLDRAALPAAPAADEDADPDEPGRRRPGRHDRPDPRRALKPTNPTREWTRTDGRSCLTERGSITPTRRVPTLSPGLDGRPGRAPPPRKGRPACRSDRRSASRPRPQPRVTGRRPERPVRPVCSPRGLKRLTARERRSGEYAVPLILIRHAVQIRPGAAAAVRTALLPCDGYLIHLIGGQSWDGCDQRKHPLAIRAKHRHHDSSSNTARADHGDPCSSAHLQTRCRLGEQSSHGPDELLAGVRVAGRSCSRSSRHPNRSNHKDHVTTVHPLRCDARCGGTGRVTSPGRRGCSCRPACPGSPG